MYDPEDDWQEDSKVDEDSQDADGVPVPGSPQVLSYSQFFKAMFQLADLWVDGVVAWDYASLLADLLHDVQLHERDSFLFSRVMQRYGYEPYYPEWMAEGPQFVPPKVLGEVDEGAEAAWEEQEDAEEQRRHDSASEEEDGEGEEEEEGEEDSNKGQAQPAARKPRSLTGQAPVSRTTPAPAAPWAHVSASSAVTSAQPASVHKAPSLWTPQLRAKILAQSSPQRFSLVARLLGQGHAPTPVSAAQLAAVASGDSPKALSPMAQQRELSGLKSLRMRFDKAARAPGAFHIPARPTK